MRSRVLGWVVTSAFAGLACARQSPPAAPESSLAPELAAAPTGAAEPPAAPAARGATPVPATPAGVQFSRWLEAFNLADRDTLLKYHEQHFPYSVASADVATLDNELSLSRATRGFDARRIDESSATALSILLQERRGGFARVRLEVEEAPPHRVLLFQIGPVPPPVEFLSGSEREARNLDVVQLQEAIQGVSSELDQHYVSAKVAQEMVARLEDNVRRGAYDTIVDAAELANRLTADLREVSHDKHLGVVFGQPPPPPPPMPPTEGVPPWIAERNFGFGSVERLPGNIARLTLNGFVPLVNDAVKAAIGERMAQIADADAAIIDLRANGGGAPNTVAFVASYFFESRLLLNKIVRRDTSEVQEFWTEPSLPTARFGSSKPVYVLTSSRTFSGGEDLAYTLQARKRALVIGEVTGGGAHPVEPRVVTPNLFVMVPWGESINPITGTNWEGVGVQPNVAVPAEQALERALELVREQLAERRGLPSKKEGKGAERGR